MLRRVPLTRAVGTGLLVGGFVAAFLMIFRPFGLAPPRWGTAPFWLILGLVPLNAGLIGALDIGLARLIARWPWLAKPRANFAATLAVVITGNVAYLAALGGHTDGATLARIGLHVTLVAAFPALFVWLYERRQRVRDVSALPDEPSTTPSAEPLRVALRDETDRTALSLPPSAILFVVADRNYVLVHTRTATQPHVLRASLKAVEAQFAGTTIVRCHRSYLVNLAHVERRQRHARGMRLDLRGHTDPIPVSATFAKRVEARLA